MGVLVNKTADVMKQLVCLTIYSKSWVRVKILNSQILQWLTFEFEN